MTKKYTYFGDRPCVTVCVTEKDGLLDRKDLVTVNWSCVGEIGLLDAMAFLDDFKKAVDFATSETQRIAGLK